MDESTSWFWRRLVFEPHDDRQHEEHCALARLQRHVQCVQTDHDRAPAGTTPAQRLEGGFCATREPGRSRRTVLALSTAVSSPARGRPLVGAPRLLEASPCSGERSNNGRTRPSSRGPGGRLLWTKRCGKRAKPLFGSRRSTDMSLASYSHVPRKGAIERRPCGALHLCVGGTVVLLGLALALVEVWIGLIALVVGLSLWAACTKTLGRESLDPEAVPAPARIALRAERTTTVPSVPAEGTVRLSKTPPGRMSLPGGRFAPIGVGGTGTGARPSTAHQSVRDLRIRRTAPGTRLTCRCASPGRTGSTTLVLAVVLGLCPLKVRTRIFYRRVHV